MKKFLIIDTSHMLHRARHVTRGDIWTQAGLALHIMLNSIKKCWNDFEADHVVFCLEGHSWRHALYAPYKKNRQTARSLKKPEEIEEDDYFFEVVDDFIKFIDERTNCTVLQNPIAEADDMIARWVQTHPDDFHIIVSGDTDFIQLLSDNTVIYDGINNRTLTHEGVYNDKGETLEFKIKSDGKLKVSNPDPDFEPDPDWVEWALFVKLIRGDTSDNIFSAFPKVRIKKILTVFEDRHNKGYEWNNFMLTRWIDHNNEENTVKAIYERNIELIDLTKQPEEIIQSIDDTITYAVDHSEAKLNIGFQFLKFAGKYELNRAIQYKESYLKFLTAPYNE